MTSANPPNHVCVVCGAQATTHISNVHKGRPTMEHFCTECADKRGQPEFPPRQKRGMSAVIIVTGLFITGLSLSADRLGFGSSAGFGWRQQGGLVLAGLLVLVGAVTRASTLIISGLSIGFLTVLADLLNFGNMPGFGWQQRLGTIIGLAMILAGLALAYPKRTKLS